METMHAAGRRRLPPVPRPAAERTTPGPVAVDARQDEIDPDEFITQVIDTRQIAAELIEAELAALTEVASEATEADEGDSTPPIEGTADVAVDDDAVDDQTDDDEADDDPSDDEPGDDDPDDDDRSDVSPSDDDATDATAKLELSELAGLIADDDVASAADAAPLIPEPRTEAVPDRTAEEVVDELDPAQQFVAMLRSSAVDFAGAAGAESAVVREAVPPARHRRARCRLVLRYADGDLADVTLLGAAGAPGRPSRHGFDRQILRWLGAGLAQDDAWLIDDPDAPDGVAVDLTAWVAAG